MGGIAQAVGGIFGSGGQGGSYTAAPITQQNLLPGIQQATNNTNQIYGQQQNLASQLQQQMMGQGPNLANAMLNQATNQNIAQAGGLMASQQGINPAMAARAASQQAGQMGQQAAAQASTNRMQQQLGAQSQLGGLYGQMGQQQLNQQQVDQNALASQNTALNQNSSIDASMAQANQKQQAAGVGGLLGGIGQLGGLAATALTGGATGGLGISPMTPQGGVAQNSFFGGANPYANGGMVPDHLQGMAQHLGYGGYLAEKGGHVAAKAPEQKASVEGDSLKNDKIPAMLSEHEIVIPREIAMGEDAPQKAAEFVAKIKGQSAKKDSGKEDEDFKSALKRGMKERK